MRSEITNLDPISIRLKKALTTLCVMRTRAYNIKCILGYNSILLYTIELSINNSTYTRLDKRFQKNVRAGYSLAS